MDALSSFRINLAEDFPHLERAPIVEAVIHWRARSQRSLEQDTLREQLHTRLPEYPVIQSQHEVHVKGSVGPQGTAYSQSADWRGFRLESQDRRYIAQFTRDGFVFSRLEPYQDWDRFSDEAKRLWGIHASLADPSEIDRLGVRFINRIAPVDLNRLDEVLVAPPQRPHELPLPFEDYLQRSVHSVPGEPYRIRVTQAAQQPAPPQTAPGLILDIDVFTTTSLESNDALLDKRLAEMRWLKNRAFFSLLTPRARGKFMEKQS